MEDNLINFSLSARLLSVIFLFGLTILMFSIGNLRKHVNAIREPWGLPIVGHLLFLGSQPWITLLRWKKKYGSVYRINLAGIRIIVVNELNVAGKIFSRPEMGGAVTTTYINELTKRRGGNGMALAEGKAAQEQRGFFLKSLHEFGIKSGKLEDQLGTEAAQLVSDLRELKGGVQPLKDFFRPYTMNATWKCIASENLKDETANMILEMLHITTHIGSLKDLMTMAFPTILDQFTSWVEPRYTAVIKASRMVQAEIDAHLGSRLPGFARDMLDKYQDTVDSTTDLASSFHASQAQIVPTMMDVLIGAVDNTATSLEWIIIYALRNPHIVTKIQQEIDTVVGRDRFPKLEDRAKMPYTEACVYETLRIRPILPLGVPRRVTQDIDIEGYRFLKNSWIIPNIGGMSLDPEVWENPEDFHPERFLVADGGAIRKDVGKLIAFFGNGKRFCPGKQIAYDTLFLFFAHLFQNFGIYSQETFPPVDAQLVMPHARPAGSVHVSFVVRT